MTSEAMKRLLDLDPDALRCPYGIYAEARQNDEPEYIPELESFLLTRYADINNVSRNNQLFSCQAPLGPIAARQQLEGVAAVVAEDPELGRELAELRSVPRVLLHADPPGHIRQRRLVMPAFAPPKIAAMVPFIRSTAETLVDRFADRGSAEIMSELANPLPIAVIARMLGVPVDDMAKFKRWSDDSVRNVGRQGLSPDEVRRVLLSQLEMFRYFGAVVADRRTNPTNDIISDLAHATIDEAPLTDGEILNMVRVFLVAGNETLSKFIAFAVMQLAGDPDLADRLRADTDLIPAFVEEVLRLEPPIQGLYRTATDDTEIGGVAIAKGQSVWMSYASGNRDERQYSEPDELRLDREASAPQLAFGIGAHFCLGAGLARTEARVTLEVLLDRLDDLRPADGTDVTRLDFEDSFLIHGPRALHVQFTRRVQPAK